ncbi:hypothetical protein BGZ80_006297, partial [Entomortierella chlamydospora]
MEIPNLIKNPKDVEGPLGCGTDKVREEARVLGLAPGQTFVVGASAVKAIPLKRRRKKRRTQDKKPGDTRMTAVTDLGLPTHYNLSVKQKAIYQPTLKFRNWLDVKKVRAIIATKPAGEGLPITHTAVVSGLGKFSAITRLISLHTIFQLYLVQK